MRSRNQSATTSGLQDRSFHKHFTKQAESVGLYVINICILFESLDIQLMTEKTVMYLIRQIAKEICRWDQIILTTLLLW
jgi:hypothetical protein